MGLTPKDCVSQYIPLIEDELRTSHGKTVYFDPNYTFYGNHHTESTWHILLFGSYLSFHEVEGDKNLRKIPLITPKMIVKYL